MPAHQKDIDTLTAWAEEFGWAVVDTEPFVATRLDRTIRVEFNMAGRPNKMHWVGGPEHTQLGSGATSMNRIKTWMATEIEGVSDR